MDSEQLKKIAEALETISNLLATLIDVIRRG